jgi:hypothetical protein
MRGATGAARAWARNEKRSRALDLKAGSRDRRLGVAARVALPFRADQTVASARAAAARGARASGDVHMAARRQGG